MSKCCQTIRSEYPYCILSIAQKEYSLLIVLQYVYIMYHSDPACFFLLRHYTLSLSCKQLLDFTTIFKAQNYKKSTVRLLPKGDYFLLKNIAITRKHVIPPTLACLCLSAPVPTPAAVYNCFL